MLNFEKLAEYDDYIVQVVNSKTGDVITGLYADDSFSFSSGANIGGDFVAGAIEGGIKGALNGGADAAGAALNKKFGGQTGSVLAGVAKDAINANYKTLLSTFQGYDGSSYNPFEVRLIIFPKVGETYSDLIYKLAKFTQPNTEADGSVILQSYLYDKIDSLETLTAKDPFKGNLLHVSIGDWFFATGLFCSGISFTLSKFVDEDRKPIYLSVGISFIPYRVLNAKELSSWMRK